MWYILSLLGAFWLVTPPAGAPGVETGSRLEEIKRDSRVYEKIVAELLRQNFENPFSIAAEPRAVFLPDFGVVVSFQLKLNRAALRGFGTEQELSAALTRSVPLAEELAKVRRVMFQALAEFGSTLKHLESREQIALSAHVEDRTELDPLRRRRDIVMICRRGLVDDFMRGSVDREAFEKAVQVVEY